MLKNVKDSENPTLNKNPNCCRFIDWETEFSLGLNG